MKKTFLTFALLFLIQFLNAQSFDGFALYNAQGSNTTYLIDENQNLKDLTQEQLTYFLVLLIHR